MTAQIRAMLDELMGTARNGESDRHAVKFSDTRVCKSFLLGCCPHEILASTVSEIIGVDLVFCEFRRAVVRECYTMRMDLGACPKIHDFALRADYENATKDRDYYYDCEAMEHLQAFIGDCDRRTEAAKKRLAETQEELTAEVAEKANKVHKLSEEIGKKLAKAESLGQAGEVEESMKLMTEIEELRAEKVKAEHEYRSSIPASSYQQQKLRVCEVCSAYLGIHDNDVRLADHFGGKLHLGFLTIREKLTELEKTAGPRRDNLKRQGRRHEYDDSFSRSRYYVGGRELDRRSRIHRSKSKERERTVLSVEPPARVERPERERSSHKSSRRSRSRSREPREPREHKTHRRSRSREYRGNSHRRDYDRRDRDRRDRR